MRREWLYVVIFIGVAFAEALVSTAIWPEGPIRWFRLARDVTMITVAYALARELRLPRIVAAVLAGLVILDFWFPWATIAFLIGVAVVRRRHGITHR